MRPVVLYCCIILYGACSRKRVTLTFCSYSHIPFHDAIRAQLTDDARMMEQAWTTVDIDQRGNLDEEKLTELVQELLRPSENLARLAIWASCKWGHKDEESAIATPEQIDTWLEQRSMTNLKSKKHVQAFLQEAGTMPSIFSEAGDGPSPADIRLRVKSKATPASIGPNAQPRRAKGQNKAQEIQQQQHLSPYDIEGLIKVLQSQRNDLQLSPKQTDDREISALDEALFYARGQQAQSSPFDQLLEQWMRMHREATVSRLPLNICFPARSWYLLK